MQAHLSDAVFKVTPGGVTVVTPSGLSSTVHLRPTTAQKTFLGPEPLTWTSSHAATILSCVLGFTPRREIVEAFGEAFIPPSPNTRTRRVMGAGRQITSDAVFAWLRDAYGDVDQLEDRIQQLRQEYGAAIAEVAAAGRRLDSLAAGRAEAGGAVTAQDLSGRLLRSAAEGSVDPDLPRSSSLLASALLSQSVQHDAADVWPTFHETLARELRSMPLDEMEEPTQPVEIRESKRLRHWWSQLDKAGRIAAVVTVSLATAAPQVAVLASGTLPAPAQVILTLGSQVLIGLAGSTLAALTSGDGAPDERPDDDPVGS